MCVKCGINSCSCCTLAPSEIVSTEGLVYDGVPITCATDSALDINTGDGLNDFFDLFKNEMCKLSSSPLKRSLSSNFFDSIGPVAESIIEIPVPAYGEFNHGDGWYNIRIQWTVSTQIAPIVVPDPVVEAKFIIGINGISPAGVNFKETQMINKHFNPVAITQHKTSFSLENIYYLNIGDEVSLTCTHFQDDFPGANNSIRFNIIVTPVKNFSYI